MNFNLLNIVKISYLKHKLPNWYRKLVCDTEVPTTVYERIVKQIKTKKLNKNQVKHLLLEIQKENALNNKALWNHYLENTLPNRYNDLKIKIAEKSNLTAVIVEAREHPHFKTVVQNIMKHLEHLNCCLHIYHGTENDVFVKEALQEYKKIKFFNLNLKNLDIEAYNKIMLSKKFWKEIPSSKVLVFQTDVISFKPLDKKFLEFDYIGAPWKKNISKKNKVSVGNGGLSIRSKQMMLSIIEQNIPRKINTPEDVYLCQIIKKQQYKLANYETALEFSTENVFNPNSFGCHKIWEETTQDQLNNLLQ